MLEEPKREKRCRVRCCWYNCSSSSYGSGKPLLIAPELRLVLVDDVNINRMGRHSYGYGSSGKLLYGLQSVRSRGPEVALAAVLGSGNLK